MAKLPVYRTKCGQVLNHFTEYVFPVKVEFLVDYCQIVKNEEGVSVYGDTDTCQVYAVSMQEALKLVNEFWSDRQSISAYPLNDYPAKAYRPEPF